MFITPNQNVASIQSLTLVEHTGVSDSLAITGTAIILPFAQDQASLSITPARSDSGTVYNYKLTCNIPRVQYALRTIAEMLYTRYVFFCTDQNGTIYTIGKRNKGYKINISGEVSADINTMQLSLNVDSREPFEIV
jgi:hypothetical protein